MKIIKIKQHLSVFISLAFIFSIIAFSPIVHKAFAQPQQASATEPADGQIIPFYEVWLRWNDVSDEDHYILSVRDITSETTQPLIYDKQYVSKNSTYFIIPINKLIRGHTYRWSLCSIASDGSKNYTPPRTFKLESGLSGGLDSHLFRTGYASASSINYFIHAPENGNDALFQQAVNSWNGISSKSKRLYTTKTHRAIIG